MKIRRLTDIAHPDGDLILWCVCRSLRPVLGHVGLAGMRETAEGNGVQWECTECGARVFTFIPAVDVKENG